MIRRAKNEIVLYACNYNIANYLVFLEHANYLVLPLFHKICHFSFSILHTFLLLWILIYNKKKVSRKVKTISIVKQREYNRKV
jgi:hypothetical protein